MNEEKAKEICDKVFHTVFDTENPFSLEEILEKFAFDVKLPKKVYDMTTNEETWASSINPTTFMTEKNMIEQDKKTGFMLPKQELNSLQDLIDIWSKFNFFTTER